MKITAALFLLLPLTLSACSSPTVEDVALDSALLTGLRIESPLDATVVRLVAPDGTATQIAANAIHEVPAGEYRVTHLVTTTFVFAEQLTVVDGEVTILALGAIDLQTLPGALRSSWRIYDPADGRMLIAQQGPNDPIAVPPGRYRLKDAFATDFVYADAVDVLPGSIAVERMGAIRINASNAECSHVSLYPANSPLEGTLLRSTDSANELLTVPPGVYQVRDALHANRFVYFDQVNVVAGQVTERSLGTIPAMSETYNLYAAGCVTALASYHPPQRPVAAPAGAYCLKRYVTGEVFAQVVVE